MNQLNKEIIRLDVDRQQGGVRLDNFLADTTGTLSRTLARKLIDLGAAHVNGRRIRKCSRLVNAGDHVEVFIDGLPLKPYELKPEHIVYQDDYLLLLNKPAGVDCQPTPSRYKGTLYAALVDYLKNPRRPDLKPSLGMVQRLDRDTSGLIIFSIHPRAHKGLTELFANRSVLKRYRTIVHGSVENRSGEIRSLLARRRATNLMKSVEKGGQEAITRYRRLTSNDLASCLDVEIPTGRSHQIRAHFSENGHPLVGDARYGGQNQIAGVEVGRQMLHASQLALRHPVTDVELDFYQPLPYDMELLLKQLSLDEGYESS